MNVKIASKVQFLSTTTTCLGKSVPSGLCSVLGAVVGGQTWGGLGDGHRSRWAGGETRAEAAALTTGRSPPGNHTHTPLPLVSGTAAGHTPLAEEIVQGPSHIRDTSVKTKVRFLS